MLFLLPEGTTTIKTGSAILSTTWTSADHERLSKNLPLKDTCQVFALVGNIHDCHCPPPFHPRPQVVAMPAAELSDDKGQEVTQLRAQVEKLAVKPRRLVLVLLADASDVIMSGTGSEVEAQFQQQKGRVVFSGDMKCRPEEKLTDDYPKSQGYRFLSSNGMSPDINVMAYLKLIHMKMMRMSS